MINQISKNQKNYGILGGTFDPIHNGHLLIAETALKELNLDKIIFIPNRISPHKLDKKVTESSHRLIMTEIATISNKNFYVSPIEIYRDGPSYAIDTIIQLINENSSDTCFYFITGTDVILDIEAWKDHETLLKLVTFVVFTRAGYKSDEFEEKTNYLQKQYNTKIIKITIPNLEISSTDIRSRVKEGKNIMYLVPHEVETYISKYGLYID